MKVLDEILTSGQTNLTKSRIAAHGRYFLHFTMAAPPSQNCPFPWGSGPHLMYGSLGPSESVAEGTSLSVQPFFAGLTIVTDRPTDRLTDRPRYPTVFGEQDLWNKYLFLKSCSPNTVFSTLAHSKGLRKQSIWSACFYVLVSCSLFFFVLVSCSLLVSV